MGEMQEQVLRDAFGGDRVLDALLEHVVYYDRRMRVVWANQAACASLALNREELIGRYCYEVWENARNPCADCPVVAAMATGRTHEHEKAGPDGRIWFVRAYPITDERGVAGALELTLDVTAYRLAQRQSLLARDFSESVIDALPGPFFLLDQNGSVIRWNRNFERLSGYSAQEIEDMQILDFVADGYRELAAKAVKEVLDQGGAALELDSRRKDGGVTPLYVTARRGTVDAATCVICAAIDNTERKRAAEAYHALVDHSLQGLIVIQNHKIVFANRAMAEISGYTIEEMLTSSAGMLHDFVHPEDRETVWQHHEKRLAGESLPERYEFRVLRKDGSVRWLEIHTSRVEYRGQPAIQAACIDVSDRRRAEYLQQLQREVAVQLSSLSNLKEALRYCLEAALKTSLLDSGGIYVVDEASGDLTLIVHTGLSEAFVACEGYYPALSHNARLVAGGEPLYGTYEGLPVPRGPAQRREGLRGIGVIPIRHDGRVVACLNVASHTADEVPTWSRVVLETIAAQVGSAISRLKIQEALQRTEREKATILNAMSETVVYQDTAHTIRWANKAAADILGMAAPEMVGRRCYELWHATTGPCGNCPVEKALKTGRLQESEVQMPDGRILALRGEPVKDRDGTMIGIVEVGLDVTERKRVEGQLRRRLQMEELLSRISADFIALQAQEIDAGIERTLAGIGRFAEADRSYIYMLRDGGARASKMHEWCAEGAHPQPAQVQDLDTGRFRWMTDQLAERGLLNIPRVDELHGPAALVKSLLESVGAKSVLSVPIRIGGRLFGFLGLSAVREERAWSEETISSLRAIAGILANALERKRSADTLEERLAFETLLSDLSATFVKLPDGRIDSEIERWLARIGELLGIDRGSVVRFSDDGPDVAISHAWAASGLPRASTSRMKQSFRWFLDRLRRGELVVCARIDDAPQEAESEKQYCRQEGIQSILVFPLVVGGARIGGMAFSTVRKPREWPDELVQRLRLVGEIFANALLRKQAQEALRRSEEQFRGIFENAVLGLYRTAPDGRILAANPALVRMLGYQCSDELAQCNVEQNGYQPGYSRAAFKELIEAQGQVVGFESAWTKRDGAPLFIRENARAVRDREGNLLYYEGTVEDITGRKRAEQALTESEVRFRELVELLPQTVFEMDTDGNFTFANRAGLEMFGYTEQEVPGSNVLQMFAAADRERAGRNVRKKLAGEPFQDHEYTALSKDGRTFPVLLYSSPIVRDGRPVGLRGIVLDITDRKRAERSLQELQDIINRSPVLVFLWRVTPGIWPVELVSDNVERALGYTAEDLMSGRVSWPGITHPEDVPRLEAEVAQYLREGRTQWSQEYRLITRSGEVRWFADQNRALANADGTVTHIQSIVLDITEKRRMEEALCQSERKYRELYEGSRDGTVATDLDGRILHSNSVFLGMLGCERDQVAGRRVAEITPARWHAEEERIIREQVYPRGYSDVFEKEYIRRDGSVFPVEVRIYLSRDNTGAPVGMWGLVRDITERKQAEMQTQQHLAELTRAWHANTLGEMASGLAHELNQPLCAILNYSNGCLRLSRKEPLCIDTLQSSIEQISAQAERAANIIKRIRGLIAKREPLRVGLDIEHVVSDAARMLQDEASKRDVTIITKSAPALPKVRGDSVEIEQVVLNLMRNAIDAMSDGGVPRRTLTVESRRLNDREVEVAVTDTGRGIPPELSERIFESFFTTKHEGLGVGLSLSRRIIEAHGGRLWVESDGSAGATFRFTLPVEGGLYGEGEPGSLRGGR